MAFEPELSECAARFAITEVIQLYCHAIDRRRWYLLERCFHADATYRYAHIEGGWRDFLNIAQATINPLPISHHQTGSISFRIDGLHAMTETYFTAYHRVAADASELDPLPGTGQDRDIVIAGRYVDCFERREGDWRIAHRIGLTDWRRDSDAADAGLFALPPSWRGSIGPEDPGCEVLKS
jgi:hypothetical protein